MNSTRVNFIEYLIVNERYDVIKQRIDKNTMTIYDLVPHLKNLNNYELHEFINKNMYLSILRTDEILEILSSFNYAQYNDTAFRCLLFYKPYFKKLSEFPNIIYHDLMYKKINESLKKEGSINLVNEYIKDNNLALPINLIDNITGKNKLSKKQKEIFSFLLNHTIENANTNAMNVFGYIIKNIMDIDDIILDKITDLTFKGIKFLKSVSESGFKTSDAIIKHLEKFDFCNIDIQDGFMKHEFDRVIGYLKNICIEDDFYYDIDDDGDGDDEVFLSNALKQNMNIYYLREKPRTQEYSKYYYHIDENKYNHLNKNAGNLPRTGITNTFLYNDDDLNNQFNFKQQDDKTNTKCENVPDYWEYQQNNEINKKSQTAENMEKMEKIKQLFSEVMGDDYKDGIEFDNKYNNKHKQNIQSHEPPKSTTWCDKYIKECNKPKQNAQKQEDFNECDKTSNVYGDEELEEYMINIVNSWRNDKLPEHTHSFKNSIDDVFYNDQTNYKTNNQKNNKEYINDTDEDYCKNSNDKCNDSFMSHISEDEKINMLQTLTEMCKKILEPIESSNPEKDTHIKINYSPQNPEDLINSISIRDEKMKEYVYQKLDL